MSSELFYERREQNQYDNLVVDVAELYREHPPAKAPDARTNNVDWMNGVPYRMYRSGALPLRRRMSGCRTARRVGLELNWFEGFHEYWSSVLGGRPLYGVDDFYFLRNWYRVKHQDNLVPDTEDRHMHVAAWQRPELLYQLFHQVYFEAHHPRLKLLRRFASLARDIGSFLEFGCATAPVTTDVLTFIPRSRQPFQAYVADIETLSLHYASFKFRKCSNVEPVVLEPDHDFRLTLPQKVDAAFCLTVFEHLQDPLRVAHELHEHLNDGGLLFFDYFESRGEGLDTRQGLEQRSEVLAFIDAKFEALPGTPSVVRKR